MLTCPSFLPFSALTACLWTLAGSPEFCLAGCWLLPAAGWLLPACLLPLPAGCREAEVEAPASALKLWPGLVDQGMAGLEQSATEEMMGQNKHSGASTGWTPIAWPLGVGFRELQWPGALRPSKLLALILEGDDRF